MLGISYGELFLIIGATTTLIGPKDLPIIARTAGSFAGRAIGYVQVAHGQFNSVMQQSQARQMSCTKFVFCRCIKLQDTISQLEAIRHEIRTISFMNPGPLTQSLVQKVMHTSLTNDETGLQKADKESISTIAAAKDYVSRAPASSDMHSQATAYAKLAESKSLNLASMNNEVLNELTDKSGLTILPVSAESARLLPNQKDTMMGSDIVLEAVLEAEVARNAKDFFSQPQNLEKLE